MPKRRTLAERAEYLSADEAAVALGMHARALKRRIQSGAITAPAKYAEAGRYLFSPEEVERAREELGLGKPLAILERAQSLGENATIRNYLRHTALPTVMMRDIAAAQERLASPMIREIAAAQERLRQDMATPLIQEIAALRERLGSGLPHSYSTGGESLEAISRSVQEAVIAAPGQLEAFDESDKPSLREEATLADVLAAVHETNRLLRVLLTSRGVTVD